MVALKNTPNEGNWACLTGFGSNIFDESNPVCLVRRVSNQEISDSFAKHETYFRKIFALLSKFREKGISLYSQPEWQRLDSKSQIASLILDRKYPGDTLPKDDDPRWIQFKAPPEKIEKQSGIKFRYWAKPGVDSSHVGAQAAERALAVSGLNRERLGFIVVATTTPAHPATPLTATLIKELLGIRNENVFCTDITAACTSYASALQLGNALISSGLYKNGLVIGADVMETTTTSPYDRNVRILLASGAVCGVLEACSFRDRGFFPNGFHFESDGSLADLIVIPAGGSALQVTPEMIIDPFDQRHMMAMNGPEVRKRAERLLLKVQKSDEDSQPQITGAIARALEKANVTYADIDFVAFHQANSRIITPIEEHMRELGFQGNVRNNIDEFGNTTSASVGLCLDHAWQLDLLKSGDLVMIVVFGGGMTVGIIIFRWTLQGFPSEYLAYSFQSANLPALVI
ncbi:ketoacyl-ACP synthase III [Candidatus Parcubacteria bacterium]|jgi:3-oxoacyl-[acyl-carrier-protein] synthase-3|nr:MAG: ketoacyl-ACP synthase III [Candidatus Parcubacteria bacterium]